MTAVSGCQTQLLTLCPVPGLTGKGTFNRAMLLNIGALEAVKLYSFQCFVFHDIDLLPEDDRNLYSCPQQPRHMSVAINTMGYK